MNTDRILSIVKTKLAESGVFVDIEGTGHRVECRAVGCVHEAAYRAEWDGGNWTVSLVTPDRWLSESIEADLMHTGDDIAELLEDELVNLGISLRPEVQHFRSEDLLYTFRSRVEEGSPCRPTDRADDPDSVAERIFTWLTAYESCFRELGDVSHSDGDS